VAGEGAGVGVVVVVVVEESGDAGSTVGAGGSGVGAVSAGAGAGSVGGGGTGAVRERLCPVVGALVDQAERSSFAGSDVELPVGAPRSVPPSVLRVGVAAAWVAGADGVSVRPSAVVSCVAGGAGSGVSAVGSDAETGGATETTGAVEVPTVASGVFFGA
jgi:hypothetical protein